MKIIDISQEIMRCNVYPGDPLPEKQILSDMQQGDLYNLTAFSMCAHNGTHVDAPLHFIKDGKSIDQIPLEAFIGRCYVARCEGTLNEKDAACIIEKAKKAAALNRILIAGDIVVSVEAAEVFAEEEILLLGNEGQSVGPVNAPMKVHQILLEKGMVLLEGIVLKEVQEGCYFLSAAPLNIAGIEGSPCRAVLIEEEKMRD